MVLKELCYQLAFKKPTEAIEYGKLAVELAQKFDDPELLAAAYNDLSIPYFLTGDFTLMLSLNQKALYLRQKLNDTLLVAASYSKIGNAYQEMSKLDSALHFYNLALAIYKQKGLLQYQAQLLNNIANINEKLTDYAGAIELRKEVSEIALTLNDSLTYLTVQGNMANTLDRMNKPKEARKIYMSLIPLSISLGYEEYLGNIYLGLGVNYKQTQQFDSAIFYYQKAYVIFQKLDSKTATAITTIDLGKALLKIGLTDSAENTLNSGIRWAFETQSYNHIYNGYLGLTELEKTKGNFKKALHYLELARIYEDSVFTNRITEKISEFRTAFQTEKKEKELVMKQLDIESKRQTIFYIIAIASLVILVLLFIFFRNRFKHQMELKQTIINEKQKGIDAVLYAQEEERKRLAKELHDGVAQSLGVLKLAFSQFKEQFKNNTQTLSEYSEVLTQLEQANQEVRNVSHQMMPRALEESGLLIALNDLVYKTEKYSPLKIQFDVLGADVNERFHKKIEISLYRIAQELLNNIIKHSNATQVNMQFRKTKQYLIFTIDDNGTGITDTLNEGIGLLNIKSRAENINGKFNIESTVGTGTSATIRIPLNENQGNEKF